MIHLILINKNYTKKKDLLDCVEDIYSYLQMGNIIG